MRTTINTREFGELTFFTGNGTNYVFVDINGQPGTLGKQICDGGGLMGSTISCRSTRPSDFEKLCKKWWRNYLRDQRGG
jgi:hypothetical protein